MQPTHSTRRGRIRHAAIALSATVLAGMFAVPSPGQSEDRSGEGVQQEDRERGDRGRRFDRGGRGMRWMSQPGDRVLRQGMRGINMRQWLEPDFLRRDLVLFADELELDEDQGEIVEALLRDYEDGFEAATENMRERLQSVRPEREGEEQRREQVRMLIDDMRAMRREVEAARTQLGEGEELDPAFEEAVRTKMAAAREQFRDLRPAPLADEELEQLKSGITDLAGDWRTLRNGLKSKFMTSLYAMLTEEQVQQWPAFDRKLRRTKTLRNGRLSGESVDLFLVLRDLDIGEEQRSALSDVLDGYAHDLDTALAARNEQLEATRIDSLAAMLDQDFEQLAEVTEAEAELRRAVRDVNDRYAELIEIMLAEEGSPETAEAFGSEHVRQGYRRVFRPTMTQRAFEVAAAMEDLDEETHLAIGGLQQAYETELSDLNGRLLETVRLHEPQAMLDRIERMQRSAEERRQRREQQEAEGQEDRERDWRRDRRRFDRDDQDDPIDEAFDDRRDLDGRYRGHLEAMLTPEQIEQLPALRRGRGNWGGERGRGREGPIAERRARMMERFDTDGDGELSDAEREAARAAWRADREEDN